MHKAFGGVDVARARSAVGKMRLTGHSAASASVIALRSSCWHLPFVSQITMVRSCHGLSGAIWMLLRNKVWLVMFRRGMIQRREHKAKDMHCLQ